MTTDTMPDRVKLENYDLLFGSTIRGKFALIVGMVLVLITAGYCYVAWGDLPSGIDRPNLPPNLFAAFMICIFGVPGLFVLLIGWKDVRREAFVRRESEVYPHEPWHWDFSWPDNSAADIGLAQAFKGLFGVLMGIGIILPANYFLIREVEFPFSVFGLVVMVLFDLILLISLGTVLNRILVQFAHRGCKLSISEFPLRLGSPIQLTLSPCRAWEDVENLKCTLRCVEEECELRRQTMAGSQVSRGRTVTKVAFQLYAEEQTITGEQIRANEPVTLSFGLPSQSELQTRLAKTPSQHWELIVEGKRPGLDLHKRFLLPVY